MNSSHLESLSNEIFEWVVSYLNLDDIRNLRLASRSTAYKGSQDTFKSFFKSKHVDLTRTDLSSFVRLTSQNGLGCLVEDLSLVGIVYNPFALQNLVKNGYRYATKDEIARDRQLQGRPIPCNEAEISKAEEDLQMMTRSRKEDEELQRQALDLALLREAFTTLAANKAHGLKRLSLQVMVYREDMTTKLPASEVKCWKWVFETASRMFNLVVSSLHDTGLHVQAFDVFHRKPDSLACSLPREALDPFDFTTPTFGLVFSRLRSLFISLTGPIVVEDEYEAQSCGDPEQNLEFKLRGQKRDLAPLRDRIADTTSHKSFAKMLELCRELSALDLSGYHFPTSSTELINASRTMRAQYIHYLSRMVPLPRLRRFRLAGLNFNVRELVTFLQNHGTTLREVELNNVSINQESFEPILSCLSGSQMDLEIIRLEDLWQSGELIQFGGQREQEFTKISGDYAGRNVIRIWGEDTKKKISYYPYVGRSIGSGRVWRWNQRRRLEFGG
ncbi:hypothetical protein PRZ48_007285 [Zasmidium cellare]|uniref:F-box domain-containing protein n=1 Tax=Zasmidium cellare TaxID=395010 RepID=A0ABR0EJP2_ZASCE|nr:hypothetical protein PRZ48_007285 [Zasmidium cellare]